MSELQQLSIIMPVFNEEATLAAAVKRVLKLSECSQLIIVDDGSTDASPQVLQSLTDKRVQLVFQTHQGKGAAIRAAIPLIQGSHVVIQDADLEYDPKDLQSLWQEVLQHKKNTVAVLGTRFAVHQHQIPWWQYWGNRVLSWYCNWLLGTDLSDMETGYKLLPVTVLKSLSPHLSQDGFGFEPELIALMTQRTGVEIREVPIHYSPRGYDQGKKITVWDGISAFWVLTAAWWGSKNILGRTRLVAA